MYPYKIKNKHLIVEIDNRNFILDTGFVSSFYLSNAIDEIIIDGKSFSLNKHDEKVDINKLIEFAGNNVDGFICMDIVSSTSIAIYKNGFIDFNVNNVEGGKMIPLINYGNNLFFEAEINGVKGNILVDTGSPYAYGIDDIFNSPKVIKKIKEYSPTIGELDCELCNVELIANGNHKVIEMCKNTKTSKLLESFHILGFINLSELYDEIMVIDCNNSCLIYK